MLREQGRDLHAEFLELLPASAPAGGSPAACPVSTSSPSATIGMPSFTKLFQTPWISRDCAIWEGGNPKDE